jgi:hypothetical protein
MVVGVASGAGFREVNAESGGESSEHGFLSRGFNPQRYI